MRLTRADHTAAPSPDGGCQQGTPGACPCLQALCLILLPACIQILNGATQWHCGLVLEAFTAHALCILSAADHDMHLQAWKKTVKRTLISELHRRVSRALSNMGLQHECEVVTDDGLFSVDIMLRTEGIIVEVDGPSHYTYNSQQRLGETCQLSWLPHNMILTNLCERCSMLPSASLSWWILKLSINQACLALLAPCPIMPSAVPACFTTTAGLFGQDRAG